MKKWIFIILLFAAAGFSAEFQVDTEADNMVLFMVQAPMEQFDGSTAMIDGFVKWEGENPLTESEFYFQVDLRDLDTGIAKRNQQMREKYLQTDKYPYAVYTGMLTAIDTLETDNEFDVKVEGTLNLHGVEQSYVIDGRISLIDSTMQVQCGFELGLQRHNIKIPKIMFAKISDFILMDLSFYMIRKDPIHR